MTQEAQHGKVENIRKIGRTQNFEVLIGFCSSTRLCCVSWKDTILFRGQADPRLAEADGKLPIYLSFKNRPDNTCSLLGPPSASAEPDSVRLKSLKKKKKKIRIEADAELVSCTALFSEERMLHHLGESFARLVPYSASFFPKGFVAEKCNLFSSVYGPAGSSCISHQKEEGDEVLRR